MPATLHAGAAFVSLATLSLYPGEIDTNPVSSASDSDVVTGAAPSIPLDLAIAFYDGDSVTSTPSESAPAGTDVTAQDTVSNSGSATQTNVSVLVTLPPNFSLDSGSLTSSAGTTAVGAGVVTWTIASLAPGETETLVYTETTDAPAAFESNPTSATATSDQDATGNTTSASVVVIPAANLTISVSDGTDSVYARPN